MIKVKVNRAGKLFRKAAENLSKELENSDDLPVFSYWCKFYGENPDEQEGDIRLIDAAVYNLLESKSMLNNLLVKYNIQGIFPATYNSTASAMQHEEKVDIWFVKPSHLSGGRGIQVISNDRLGAFDLPKFNIIQEGIENIALIDGRKFTIRVYTLLWNNKLYMFDDGFALLHGPRYRRGSTDYKVQVDHRGYQNNTGGIEMRRLSSLSDSSDILEKAAASMRRLIPALEDVLAATSPLRYLILGTDALLLDDGGLKFIEINAIPNFLHSPNIDEEVNIPLFEHVMRIIYGIGSNRFSSLSP
jgi:hypothetical protein